MHATPNYEGMSPFSDPPVPPYRDRERDMPTPNTPAYTGRQGQGYGGPAQNVRRRGEHDEEVEMQVGYAR